MTSYLILPVKLAMANASTNSLNIGIALEPPHLDPTASAAGAIDSISYVNIYEGLTRIDEHGEVQPLLAKFWNVSKDGLTYTFHLHENVAFHDGSAMNCEAVKFSLDRARASDSVNAQKQLFKSIESVNCPGPYEVVVRLNHRSGSLLYNLGWGDAVIVSPKSANDNKSNPVGTGPFRFQKWQKGQQVTIIRNDQYWGPKPSLDKVAFKFISNPNAALAAILSGDLDAFSGFPAPEALMQLMTNDQFQVDIGTSEGETILAMNNKKGPLANLKVRQAIAHAIKRQFLIEGAMFGFGKPIGSHFAPHHPAYVDLTGLYPYDPQKAKELLKEAGYEGGFDLTLKLPPPSYARRSGELIASELSQVGINVTIIPVEWAQWLSDVFKNKDYDLTIVSHTEPMDIGIYARDDYYFNYESDAFKAVMEQLERTEETSARFELMKKAQVMIAKDCVNAFLFQLPHTTVRNAKLQGLWVNAPIQAIDLTTVQWSQ
ncbi:ABC transporter substrate-binding protein [Polycladidibacter stylochi]|uniref:ABC transporter substrate-binding protein n=1 Tax=Polycladidibacter stylochi TaxID=1807766 RepID=UPI001FCAF7A1|nr:ABC transporter substrate-binding protein [Pseudovibrio stylochi]